MAGDGQVSASDQTLQEANALQGEINQLDEELQQILTTGNNLANGTNWQGPHRDTFAEAWTGEITTSLNKSVEALRQMNKDAETSATNIQAAGGKGIS
jgi:Proteins of 100 residues with WXG